MTTTAIICVAAACTPFGKKHAAKNRAPVANFTQKPPRQALKPNNPLHIATTYWATEYQKNPSNPKAALAYAKNLKAIGAKDRAMTILRQAHLQHPSNTEIASTYGRLVLAKGQTKLALRILKKAEVEKGKTDWRVLSAQGTAHAKLGEHALAQQYFSAALAKNPGAPSLLNNLALSYAMSGNAAKAEPMLRHAMKSGHDTPKVRQNLALVLGLQKKFKEARQVAAVDLTDNKATANMAYLRSMVRNQKVAAADAPQKAPQKLAMKAPVETPKKSSSKRKAPKLVRTGKPKGRQVTSQTMPLPWAKTAPPAAGTKASTKVRVASAKPVPLPAPKPKASAPTTRAPAPAAPGKHDGKPSATKHNGKAQKASLPKSEKTAAQISSWTTKVANANPRKTTQSLLYPDLD